MYPTDLEFALVLLPSHFAPGEVEPGPAAQGWRDALLTALFHLIFNTRIVTQEPAESSSLNSEERSGDSVTFHFQHKKTPPSCVFWPSTCPSC